MAKFLQLEEKAQGRLPKIWLINAQVDSGRLTFELGYLGYGYGGGTATLVPVGATSPEIRVIIPKQVRNLQNGVLLAKGGYFTIEGSID